MADRYFVLNKPADMVSQFLSSDDVPLLSGIRFCFPGGTHAIGRLDRHSEGLLLLTTDKKVTQLIFSSATPHERSYLVMVQKVMSTEAFEQLKNGVKIRIKNGVEYLAKPKEVLRVCDPAGLYPWSADSRERFPHTWLLITLTEGKYRQVRKMTGVLGHRCLRLIRLRIENITLDGIAPGMIKELEHEEFYRLAGLK